MKVIPILFFNLLFVLALKAQIGDVYYVNTDKLNLRIKPTSNSESLGLLSKGFELYVVDVDDEWFKVEFEEYKGWVNKNFIVSKRGNSYQKVFLKTGDSPECDNMNWRYDYESRGSLKISVGRGVDFAVKVMDYKNDECIRAFYIRSGESLTVTDIPQGRYYLKIGSGLDFRQGIEDEKCLMMFNRLSSYKISKDSTNILDFVIRPKRREIKNGKEYEVEEIPRYELFLQVPENRVSTGENLNTESIGVKQFNQ